MVINKLILVMANWPALAISYGWPSCIVEPSILAICRPCHPFEESVLNSNTKEFSEFNGKGGKLPVHGVLRKKNFLPPSDPLIKVLADV